MKRNAILIMFVSLLTYICNGQILSREEYTQLSQLFAEDVQMKEDATKSFLAYKSQRTTSEYIHNDILTITGNPQTSQSIKKILIIVNIDIYNKLKSKIERYAYDINYVYNCDVILDGVSGGDHIDIKNLILDYKNNLSGVVFIGDIAAAWYENQNDHNKYGYSSWPCDLYYMDIDGIWNDNDQNGIYDSHTGNVQPEIFVGRISVANMGNLTTEQNGLSRYLDKNHEFWMGNRDVKRKYGLSYTDKDWASLNYFKTDISNLYGNANYDSISFYGSSTFGKTDYLNKLLDNKYEFIQLSCHANPSYLQMSGGGIYSDEIYHNKTKAIGFNLFCCSGCNWTGATSTRGFLAGSHIYNSDEESALVVIGSTKTGSMLNFAEFYKPLGQGKTIGEALRSWWVNSFGSTHTDYIVSWHYGMSIIGDPMINFHHCLKDRCENQITLNGFDASNPASCHYIVAEDKIIVNNYIIPSGKHVIFKAKEVILNPGFECQPGGSFEIISEGCKSNCK